MSPGSAGSPQGSTSSEHARASASKTSNERAAKQTRQVSLTDGDSCSSSEAGIPVATRPRGRPAKKKLSPQTSEKDDKSEEDEQDKPLKQLYQKQKRSKENNNEQNENKKTEGKILYILT